MNYSAHSAQTQSSRAVQSLAVDAENAVGERRDGGKRFVRLLAMWRVADARQDDGLDRAVALLFDDPHLRERAVRVGRALYHQHRYADVGERIRGIEIGKF